MLPRWLVYLQNGQPAKLPVSYSTPLSSADDPRLIPFFGFREEITKVPPVFDETDEAPIRPYVDPIPPDFSPFSYRTEISLL